MVIQTIYTLNEKDGSTLQAIRKHILSTYDLGRQQTASFNNLTLKAIQKAVAIGDLEHSHKSRFNYRLSAAYKKKRDAQIAKAHYGKAGMSKV
jgi:hypothetical protein